MHYFKTQFQSSVKSCLRPLQPSSMLCDKHIVFVLGCLNLGGAERQAILLAQMLRDNYGARVTVCGLVSAGNAVALCEEHSIPWRVLHFRWSNNRRLLLVRLARLTWQIRKMRADVVMAYTRDANVPCGLVWQLTGARAYVWNQREEGSDLRASRLEKRAIASATAIISNAQHAAEMLIERFQLNGAKVNLVLNGVILAISVETRKQWRSRLEISEHTFVACMVANYTRRKDHETLLRAWELVSNNLRQSGRNGVLLLAGRDGNRSIHLKGLAFDLGLGGQEVRFLGPVKDISGLLYATDLLVHSSFLEGCPNGVLEAMAVGLPVAATDIPGIREAVGPAGYEHLAPVGDPDTLAKRILRFALDAQLRQEVGAANRARIAMFFSPERMCRTAADVLSRCLQAT
jgi:glycosyltransferase involved in cell wall biosynthesis